MEYWKLRNEQDKRYLVIYGSRIEYKETFDFHASWDSFESLEEAYTFANQYEFKEVFEWFVGDTAVAVFLHRHFSRTWVSNENLVYIFANHKDKEVQLFSDLYTLMYMIAKYDLVPNQFTLTSEDKNYNLSATVCPKIFIKSFEKSGYKQLGYVDYENEVYR
jgi:hypothetical protein